MYDGAVNVTLQAAGQIICDSLNELSDDGLVVPGVGDQSVAWLLSLSGNVFQSVSFEKGTHRWIFHHES